MTINDRAIDQAFSDLKETCFGVRNDYFGLLYIEQEFGVERDRAITHVAFGGNDYGVDGFYFEREKRNLYLLQFKYSDSHAQFKPSFNRLIEAGMARIFGAQSQDQKINQLLLQIKSSILENTAIIDRVCIHFVFIGDPAEAERSQVLDKLREDLENKKYLIDQHFGRPITMVIEFRSARTKRVGPTTHLRKTHSYRIQLDSTVTRPGPNGESMTIGFIRLAELHAMYLGMGQRFLDRNIRGALPPSKAVNRSINQSIKRIVLDGKQDATVFAFNHNGVTLFAAALDNKESAFTITEPRLLNGAQTVTTFAQFVEANNGNKLLNEQRNVLNQIHVLCRIITHAADDFVTSVTINNNRQNPVSPWNLHANDMIQLELQDKFRDDLGIFYERQEGAFDGFSDEDLEAEGITEYKAIELKRLAQTFLASDGDLDKLKRFREVFEDDRVYNLVFDKSRVKADSRKIVLCYKIQFRLPRLMKDIMDKGVKRYAFVKYARNLLWALLCQAILNDPNLEGHAEEFGKGLSIEAQYTTWVSGLATTRCRFLLSELVEDRAYAPQVAEEKFDFLRTNGAFKRSMEIAYKKWGWVVKRLNK